ncbi:MAG: GNAT family N-acetyltransferase, partial [Methanoregula sp.]
MSDPIQTVQPPTTVPTAQENADASAAWLAQNHPEWNQQAGSAEQAAAMNAAYINNQLPVRPKMGTPTGGTGNQNETIRIYDTTGLSDPRNQQGVARDVTRSEYIQIYGRTPEQSEAAKYKEFNEPINFAAYANTPLSSMPANVASRVQDYFQANPSAAYQEQVALYSRNVGSVATGGGPAYRQGDFVPTVAAGAGGFTGRAAEYKESWTPLSKTLDIANTRAGQQGEIGATYASVSGLPNPFRPDSAAGIAWDVAATGGYVGKSVSEKIVDPNTGRPLDVPKSWVSSDAEQSTVPVHTLDTSKWFAMPSGGSAIPGQDMYFRIGDTGKTQLKEDAKMIYAESGAFELIQVVPNNIPGSNFTRIYPWITAGGSDYALQGSAVSGKPLVTVEGKQSNALVYDEYGMNRMWATNTAEGSVADRILSGIGSYSKAGRELYGGMVQPTDNRTIQSEFAKGNMVMPGGYSPAIQSYSELVTVEAENAPKGSISSEVNLPWFGEIGPGQFASMPPVQKVDMEGNLSSSYVSFIPIESQLPTPFRSTSAPAAVTGTTATDLAAYAAPAEVSQAAGRPATPLTVFGPEVEAWGMGAAGTLAATIFPPLAAASGVSKISGVMQSPAESAPVPGTEFVYRTDPAAVIMEGALFLGDYLPMGAATPGRDLLKSQGQAENPTADAFNTDFAKVTAQRETYTALGSTIETQRMGLDKMLEGKINAQGQFTGTASEYTQYQSSLADLNANVAKYNEYGDQYKDVLAKGFASGAIIKSGEGFIVNPDNEHPYGAFSDWSASVTKTLRGGVTESQVIAFEQTPEFKEAGPVMWLGEGLWKGATKPTALAGSFLQGVEIYATMGLANVGLAGLGARGAAMGGAGGGALETVGFGGQRVLQSGAFQYGLGGLLIGGSVWSATEGFTAPAEQAWSRGGELTTNLVAMGWGGLSPEGVAVATRGIGFPNLGLADTMAGRGGGVTYRTGPDLPPGPSGSPTNLPPSGPTGGSPMGGAPMGGEPAPSGGWSFTDYTNPIGRQSRVFNSNIEDWYRPAPTESGGAAALPAGEVARPSVEWTFAKEIPMSQEPAALPSGSPSYNIRRVFDETYVPAQDKLPSMSEDMFTAGSALDVGAQRLIATSETGQVVGATAFEVRGNEIFVKSMGSRQAGVGTAMTQELIDIAMRHGVTKITGESRPQAVGFWEKMGADVMGKGAYSFEIRVGGETPTTTGGTVKLSTVEGMTKILNTYGKSMRVTQGGVTKEVPIEEFARAYELKTGRKIDMHTEWDRYLTETQQIDPTNRGRPVEGERGQELKPQPETIDLRQTIDLRPYAEPRSPLNIPTKMEFDLTNTQVIENPTRYVDRYATPTEREMIFQQYEFTPAEIEFAKLNKASLNDVLARRESMVQPMHAMEPLRAMEPMRGTYGTQE